MFTRLALMFSCGPALMFALSDTFRSNVVPMSIFPVFFVLISRSSHSSTIFFAAWISTSRSRRRLDDAAPVRLGFSGQPRKAHLHAPELVRVLDVGDDADLHAELLRVGGGGGVVRLLDQLVEVLGHEALSSTGWAARSRPCRASRRAGP